VVVVVVVVGVGFMGFW